MEREPLLEQSIYFDYVSSSHKTTTLTSMGWLLRPTILRQSHQLLLTYRLHCSHGAVVREHRLWAHVVQASDAQRTIEHVIRWHCDRHAAVVAQALRQLSLVVWGAAARRKRAGYCMENNWIIDHWFWLDHRWITRLVRLPPGHVVRDVLAAHDGKVVDGWQRWQHVRIDVGNPVAYQACRRQIEAVRTLAHCVEAVRVAGGQPSAERCVAAALIRFVQVVAHACWPGVSENDFIFKTNIVLLVNNIDLRK